MGGGGGGLYGRSNYLSDYVSCAVSLFLVKIATFSWPPFVTWVREG